MGIINNNQIDKSKDEWINALYAAKIITELNDKDFEIKDGVLIKCHSEDKVIIVPDGVKRIASNAFVDMNIDKIVFPNSLEVISDNAFSNCRIPNLYLPDGLAEFGSNYIYAQNGTSPKISCNWKTKLPSWIPVSNLEIRMPFLKRITHFLELVPDRVSIVLSQEPFTSEWEVFYHNLESISEIPYFIKLTVYQDDVMKSQYHITKNVLDYAIIGDNLNNISLVFLMRFKEIYFDNTNGKGVEELKKILLECANSDLVTYNILYKNAFRNLKIYITGNPLTLVESVRFNYFLKKIGCKHKAEFCEDPNALRTLEISEHQSKKVLNMSESNGYDKDIEEAINKVKKAIEDLTEDDKNVVLNQVNGLIAKYKDNLTKVKPSLDFNEDIPFGEVEETADSLREKLLRDLNTIENKFLMGNHYHELQDKIEDYEALINEQFIIEPTEIISVEDKIKYIIFFAKRYNQNNYINKLKDIFTKFKSDISEYCLKRVNSDILENTEDLNLAFNLRIDELYGEIQRFGLIYDCFYTPEKSTLAEDIVNIRDIISLFDIENKEKYSTMLEELINKYYYDILTNKKDLKEGILELRKELMPFLEDLNKNAATFINYGNILNSLNHEKQNRALSIKTLYEELMAYIEESNLDQMNKDLAITELNKVVEKWKDKIKRKDLSTKEVDDPFKLEKMPISDDNIMLQIKVLKDFYKVKATVDAYLLKKKAYDKVANKSIDTIEDTKPR